MDICDKWKLNKLVNPRTGRSIKPTGKVYAALKTECSDGSPRRIRSRYSLKCIEWHNRPNINPETGRVIKINGPTYRKLEDECGSVVAHSPRGSPKGSRKRLSRHLSPECIQWNNNPTINPRTGRTIKINGPVYNQYVKECGPLTKTLTNKKSDDNSEHENLVSFIEWLIGNREEEYTDEEVRDKIQWFYRQE